jgi:hypothetical protein
MLNRYPTIRKVDKPDDKELLALLALLIERTNDIYYITQALEGDYSETPIQLISPSALRSSNIMEYIHLINYVANDIHAKISNIGTIDASVATKLSA